MMPMKPPPKALFFDLNGTLADWSQTHIAVRRVCDEVAAARPSLDAARLFEANGRIWRDYWPSVEEQWNLGVLDGAAVGLAAWRRALDACGCADEALAALARDALRRHQRGTVRLYGDVAALLEHLAATGLPLAVVTNAASDSARDGLDALGIASRFAAIVVSGEVRVAKPDPAIFTLAAERLGVDPSDGWHVGDSLAADVAGARAAGLGVVWLNRGALRRADDDPQPDHEIRSLAELVDLLTAAT
jgi:2-haloalkanoic acid dehalogenase type II